MGDDHQRRVVAITGAGGGLGAEIAQRVVDDGFAVALLDMQEGGLQKTLSRVQDESQRALAVTADLTDDHAVSAAFTQIDAHFGRLDGLVNLAGGSGSFPIRSLQDITGEIWRSVLDSNLTSAFLCSRNAVPLMERNAYGRIINFSSAVAHGKFGASGTVGARLPYAASKAALHGLTKQLAKDLGRSGITVNVIAPGLILPEQGRVRDIFESQTQEARTATTQAIPVGRTGTGTEIAAAVSYLLSEEAGFTTGAILAVDGAEV